MRLVELAGLSELEEVISNLQSGESVGTRSVESPPRETPVQPGHAAQAEPEEKRELSSDTPEAEPEENRDLSPASGDVVDQLLFRLQKENLPLHATLSHAREMTHEEDTLKIVFEQSAAFHYRMLEPEMQHYLARLCREITESEARVEVTLLGEGAEQVRKKPDG